MQHRWKISAPLHAGLVGLACACSLACVTGPPDEDVDIPEVEDGSGGSLSGDGDGDGAGDGDGDGTTPISSLFPEEGQSWLFIGQDLLSIVNYADEVGTPPGIVGYTSLRNLEGLTTLDDQGGGPNHMHGLAARYPDANIAIGLYLVDYLDEINSGEADSNIAQLGETLAVYDRPVLLRVGYEFDADWTHYHPQQYIQAYRRVADGIRETGADQVAFVWQSAALCGGRYGSFALDAWYPGDDYVDWMGLSYFTQVGCGFAPVHEVVDLAREYEKPLFIAEATPQWYDLAELTFSADGVTKTGRSAAQIWSDWFEPFFAFISENADVVRGVTYINADWDQQVLWGPPYAMGYWGDTRVQANETILNNWKSALADQGWGPSP